MINRRQRCPGIDGVSPVEPLTCTEQFGKRGHVPPLAKRCATSLSEATRGAWLKMSNGHSDAATFPPKRQMTEEQFHEDDSGDGPGCGNGRDEAGGAARAPASDKRRHRSDSCIGIRPD